MQDVPTQNPSNPSALSSRVCGGIGADQPDNIIRFCFLLRSLFMPIVNRRPRNIAKLGADCRWLLPLGKLSLDFFLAVSVARSAAGALRLLNPGHHYTPNPGLPGMNC
jgi:hypothetical protein